MVHETCKHHNKQPPKVSSDSLSQVWFPTCQVYLSKFDVTTLSNFQEVLKTSVQRSELEGLVTSNFNG